VRQRGPVVQAPRSWDYFEDNRLSNDTWVGIEQNAGFTGALAGLNEVTGTYDQCLQGYGILSRDKVICDSVVLN
jgi:endoglucanase